MFRNKYSNFLTIILIVAIVSILALATVFVVNIYKKHKNNAEAMRAINQFENNIGLINGVSSNNNAEEVNTNTDNGDLLNLIDSRIEEKNQNSSTSQGTVKRNVTYYNSFVMLGYIEIPKINIKYPILEEESVASLEKAVAVRYPSEAILNSAGNVVIAGHNYRNGQFFSNLKKLAVGDTIKITDGNKKTLTYKIYEVYQTTPEDTAYITRDCGNNIEITLVTCTDDSNARIIVKART